MSNIKSTKIIITLQLIIVASCHVLPVKEDPKPCSNFSLEYICSDNIRASRCNELEFCTEHNRNSTCEKGPKYYCKTKSLAKRCEREAFCLTWADDSIRTVKMTERPAILHIDLNKYSPGQL